jgi:hypothetical protein
LVFNGTTNHPLGTYLVTITAKELKYGASVAINFNLILDCKVQAVQNDASYNTQTEYTYAVGSDLFFINLPAYRIFPASCAVTKRVKLQVYNSMIDGRPNANAFALPEFISFDQQTSIITVFGRSQLNAQHTYTFFVQAEEPVSRI